MQKIGPTGRTWLKGFHILFTSTWVGAALCMILLHFISPPTTGSDAHARLMALKLIDDWIIIPSAIGTLISSILISSLTSWGFFKWHWVTVKWVLTITIILFGTFFLGPWLNGMETLAATNPETVLQDPVFRANHQFMSYAVGPQLLLLLAMIFISVIKPWKGKRTPKA